MHNFINEAVLGKQECHTRGSSIAQEAFWSDLMDWWNSLEPMYKYIIIGGSGLVVVVVLLLLFKGR